MPATFMQIRVMYWLCIYTKKGFNQQNVGGLNYVWWSIFGIFWNDDPWFFGVDHQFPFLLANSGYKTRFFTNPNKELSWGLVVQWKTLGGNLWFWWAGGHQESYRRKHVWCCWNMPHIWFLGSFFVLNCFIEQVAGGSAKLGFCTSGSIHEVGPVTEWI